MAKAQFSPETVFWAGTLRHPITEKMQFLKRQPKSVEEGSKNKTFQEEA